MDTTTTTDLLGAAKIPNAPNDTPSCVNLAARFGQRFRIGWEANGATRKDWPPEEQAWLMELPCRYGRIHPHGGDILCAVVEGHPGIAGKLRRLSCIRRRMGDVELRAYFHVDDAATVFRLMRPYRKAQLSADERERRRRSMLRLRQERGISCKSPRLYGARNDESPKDGPVSV